MRNVTTSGKTLPTIVLIFVPSITIVVGTVIFPVPVAGISFCVVAVYIFYPSGQKYFKKREYQKGIEEFECTKQILLVEIPLIFAVYLLDFFISRTENLPLYSIFNITATLNDIVVVGLRIGLLIVRKEFRFYFAKGCISIIPHKEEFEQMRYLRLGLDSL
jgi:hypothetical protein